MGTMTIPKVVLLLGVFLGSNNLVVSSWPISENPIISTTSNTRRDVTTPSTSSSSSVNWSTDVNNFQGYSSPRTSTPLSQGSSQAATTVKISTLPKPTQSATHTPHRRYETTPQTVQHGHQPFRTGQFPQPTGKPPTLQGGFQVSQDPRLHSLTDGFSKPSSYNPTSGQRFRNNVGTGGNRNSPYSEPNKTSQPIKINSFPPLGGPSNFANVNAAPATRSNRQSPTGFEGFDRPSKFNFGPSNVFNVQTVPHQNSAHGFSNPTYKILSNNGFKNPDVPNTSFASGFSGAPSFPSFNNLGDNYGRGPNVGFAGKQISNPHQFRSSNPPISSFVKAFENEPVFLGTGTNYQSQPSSGLTIDFTKPNPSSVPNGPSYFPTAAGNYQSHALPVRSASGGLQSPRFQTTSVNSFGNNPFATPEGGYQLLANQPQLHFASARPLQTIGSVKPAIFHSKRPFEQIRTDVEVINKKKPQLPEHQPDYEHDFNGGFKVVEDVKEDEDDYSAPAKNSEREISFEVPRSDLFDSYDAAFGKYSKLASAERNSGRVNNAKPVNPSADDDDERENKSGEHRSSYSDEGGPTGSYEVEDEEESRRNERLEVRDKRGGRNGRNDDEDDEDDDDDKEDVGSKAYSSYGVDFEKDFEDSYRKELPQNDYVHVKEVPEIDDAASKSKKSSTNRKTPRTARRGTKQKSRRVIEDASEDPKAYETYTTHNYETPKFPDTDSEGHFSGISYAKTKSSESDDVQPYGYKISRNRGTKRYVESDNHETPITDDQSRDIDSNKASNNREIKRSHKSSRQSSDDSTIASTTASSIEYVNGFVFPSFGNGDERPLREKASRNIDSYGAPSLVVRAFDNPQERDYGSRRINEQSFRYFGNDRST